MGHIIGYMVEHENVKRSWVLANICKYAEDEGDGYSGAPKWHDEIAPLEDEEAAKKKISQLDKGWYDDHAVRFYSYSDAKPTDKMVSIRQRIAKLNNQLNKYVKENSVRQFKADYIGCRNCGSKLRRDKLRGEFCPLCNSDLRSKTVQEKIKDYNERISKSWNEIEAEKRKQKNARKVMWLIKYEFHC